MPEDDSAILDASVNSEENMAWLRKTEKLNSFLSPGYKFFFLVNINLSKIS